MRKKLSEIQPGQRFLGHANGVWQMIGKCVSDYYAVQNVITLSTIELSDAEYEVVTEPTYRPFANAAEFEPHRDRWCKWKNDPGTHLFRATSYHESVVWFGVATTGNRFDNAFTDFTFDDGTPFGVLDE